MAVDLHFGRLLMLSNFYFSSTLLHSLFGTSALPREWHCSECTPKHTVCLSVLPLLTDSSNRLATLHLRHLVLLEHTINFLFLAHIFLCKFTPPCDSARALDVNSMMIQDFKVANFFPQPIKIYNNYWNCRTWRLFRRLPLESSNQESTTCLWLPASEPPWVWRKV